MQLGHDNLDDKPGLLNPFAPQGLQGIANKSPEGFDDVEAIYVLGDASGTEVGILPGVTFTGVISIDTDSDFVLLCLMQSLPLPNPLLLRMTDDIGEQITGKGWVVMSNVPADQSVWQFPVFPMIVYPRGSQIQVQIQNLDGAATIPIQLQLYGMKRFNSNNLT